MRIYGPVPSRRFGLSLGVDLVPRKVCSFDCIYCQVGPTDRLIATPDDFYAVDEVIADIESALEAGPRPDVLTFAGSGEPTLYRSLGQLIDRCRDLTDIPILLITNSSQFWRDEVALAACKVDVLAPSLDAGDDAAYQRINRPHLDITYDRLLGGLERVTQAFQGEIRLEVMLIRDINDNEASLQAIARQLAPLRFDQVDVNTPVRPPIPERSALPCYKAALDRARALFGPTARAIGRFESQPAPMACEQRPFTDLDKDIRETLQRRPCTVEDLIAALGVGRGMVLTSLHRLTSAGLINTHASGSETYFHAL
ncbi:MAG: radical SAM protein [Myxococcota bacterium]|nr:radical SAM protein [Myxococcota bacterium]